MSASTSRCIELRSGSSTRASMLAASWLVLGVSSSCIIPDSDIRVEPERTNLGSVRLVQAIGLSNEIDAACRDASSLHLACPVPPTTIPVPGLIALEDDQDLCTCPVGESDLNAVGSFDIYVEDGDRDDEGNPTDRIFGAFTLDVADPDQGLRTVVAYTNLLSPEQPAQLVPSLGDGSYRDPIERPPPNLKSWTVGAERGVDLCNDNNGAKLAPGLYNLRLVVTDRPWYVPVELDSQGRPVYEDGVLQRQDADPIPGVPDLPAGATYDVANFVFRCLEPEDERCDCVEEAPDQ